LSRNQLVGFFEKLAPCLIGMEACASPHRYSVKSQGIFEWTELKRKLELKGEWI
jgi:hypothetical protein